MEREALRFQTTELIQRLRGEENVPQALFELLDTIVRRLDRIELGTFAPGFAPGTFSPDEIPTKPERRASSQIAAVKSPEKHPEKPLAERIEDIFSEGKK